MGNYPLSLKRRCKCEYHIGHEPWHGSVSGKTYHACSCDYCLKAWAAYYRDKYQSDELFKERRKDLQKQRYVPKPPREHKPTLVERRKALWAAQDGLCAVCHKPLPFEAAHLDHDHACCDTKAKDSCGTCDRGAVHPRCNSVVSLAEDAELLSLALVYLTKADATQALS